VAKKPAPKKPAARNVKVSSGRPAGLFTWLAVGLVVVVVAVLVIVKVSSGSSTTSGTSAFQATDATTVQELTKIPLSVFNTIGVDSPVAPVSPPSSLKGQPLLTATNSAGKTVPEVFYLGAEYCPFCAAERWSTIVALSRFGTWSNLGNTTSSSIDVYPSTPTFTFYKATYSSPYLAFRSIEETTNQYNSATQSYGKLQTPTKQEQAIFTKYDTSKYIPGLSASSDGSIPFITMGNKFLVSGASYTPATLGGLTRSQIAAALSTTTSPVTEAIIASANYQSAALCTLTNNLPANVCTSSGVLAAKKIMKL
jgi:hypothetical protein